MDVPNTGQDTGQAIREAVDRAGGQTAVADAAGVSRPHLANWIAGRSRLRSAWIVKVWRATGEGFDLAAASDWPREAAS